jgi:hypothetical protein
LCTLTPVIITKVTVKLTSKFVGIATLV